MAKASKSQIATLERQVAGMRKRSRMTKIREASGQTLGHVIRTLEVGGSAYGFGWWKGAYGPKLWFGASNELMSGLILHGLALFDVGDGMGPHFANIGDGALASYLHTKGVGAGAAARAARPAITGAHNGQRAMHGADELSDVELNRMAQAPA